MSAKLMTVIVTDMECRGKGVEGDPFRRITQYWTEEGELLVEKDPCPSDALYAMEMEPGFKIEQMTCKWKETNKGYAISPHDNKAWCTKIFKFCPTCGKKIEVVE
jgi:hypothetical protein